MVRMDEVNPNGKFLRFLDRDGRLPGRRQDYRERLGRPWYAGPAGMDREMGREMGREMDGDVTVADASAQYAERVRALVHAAGRDTTVFQAVVVAALQTLNRALCCQRQAATASISLAQGEKMRHMVASSEAMIAALTETLSKQGSKMLHLCGGGHAGKSEASWWYALTETMQTLEEGIGRMGALVYGQPRGAPARTLSSLVIRLMHAQHQALLSEADHWIS